MFMTIKKSMVILAIMAIVTALYIGAVVNGAIEILSNGEGRAVASAKQVEIVEEKGWKVVKDNDPNTSTVIATVTSGDADEDGYITVTNIFDENDTIAIHKDELTGLTIGDEVTVTFEQDDVIMVKRY